MSSHHWSGLTGHKFGFIIFKKIFQRLTSLFSRSFLRSLFICYLWVWYQVPLPLLFLKFFFPVGFSNWDPLSADFFRYFFYTLYYMLYSFILRRSCSSRGMGFSAPSASQCTRRCSCMISVYNFAHVFRWLCLERDGKACLVSRS